MLHSHFGVKLWLSALGECYLHCLGDGRLLPTHGDDVMVEGRDEGSVYTQETAPFAEHLRVRRFFHFQLVTAAGRFES